MAAAQKLSRPLLVRIDCDGRCQFGGGADTGGVVVRVGATSRSWCRDRGQGQALVREHHEAHQECAADHCPQHCPILLSLPERRDAERGNGLKIVHHGIARGQNDRAQEGLLQPVARSAGSAAGTRSTPTVKMLSIASPPRRPAMPKSQSTTGFASMTCQPDDRAAQTQICRPVICPGEEQGEYSGRVRNIESPESSAAGDE